MEITKEQLRQLLKNNEEGNDQLISADLKSWFPSVFAELRVGRWYYVDRGRKESRALVLFQGHGVDTFGFCHDWEWTEDYGSTDTFKKPNYDYTMATYEEVGNALIEEAVRRGYKNGNHDCLLMPNVTHKDTDEVFYFNDITERLHIGESGSSNIVYTNGKWADILETITLEEAEKLLNKRIV